MDALRREASGFAVIQQPRAGGEPTKRRPERKPVVAGAAAGEAGRGEGRRTLAGARRLNETRLRLGVTVRMVESPFSRSDNYLYFNISWRRVK
jgi:hypothetical protein